MPPFLPQQRINPGHMRVDSSPLVQAFGQIERRQKEAAEKADLKSLGDRIASDGYGAGVTEAMRQGRVSLGSQLQGVQDRRQQRAAELQEKKAARQRKLFGNQALMVMREKNPRRQAAMWKRIYNSHPNAAALGPEYSDPYLGAALLLAESGQARDLIGIQQADARLDLQRSQIGAANQRHADTMGLQRDRLQLDRNRLERAGSQQEETTEQREMAKLTVKDRFATQQLQQGGQQVLRMIDDLGETFRDPNIGSVIGPIDSRTPDIFSSSRTLRGKINQGMQAINSTMQRTLLKGGGSITESERASIDKIQGDLQSARTTREVEVLMNNYRQIIRRIFRLDGEASTSKEQGQLPAGWTVTQN